MPGDHKLFPRTSPPSLTGLQDIQRWTRESLRSKPFSLVLGKQWTRRPGPGTDLRHVYTNLTILRRGEWPSREPDPRKSAGIRATSEILDPLRLGVVGPARILVEGTLSLMVPLLAKGTLKRGTKLCCFSSCLSRSRILNTTSLGHNVFEQCELVSVELSVWLNVDPHTQKWRDQRPTGNFENAERCPFQVRAGSGSRRC